MSKAVSFRVSKGLFVNKSKIFVFMLQNMVIATCLSCFDLQEFIAGNFPMLFPFHPVNTFGR